MNHRNTYRRRFWPIPFLILGAGLFMGGAVMLLWNAILPALLDVKPITYWQAVGLLALSRILFGNFGGRMRRPGSTHWSKTMDPENLDSPDQSKPFGRFGWRNMSDEERARFRNEMRRRCRPPEK
jgi:hypothetical protein